MRQAGTLFVISFQGSYLTPPLQYQCFGVTWQCDVFGTPPESLLFPVGRYAGRSRHQESMFCFDYNQTPFPAHLPS
jgi:hypothetical protein